MSDSHASTSELLTLAKRGEPIPESELRRIATLLRDENEGDEDRYTLIHILGLAGGTPYRDTIAQFLSSPEDPMLARIAVVALCQWLGLCAEYRDELLEFVLGVDWDVGDDVKQVALSALGEHLRSSSDAEVWKALVGVADDPTERRLLREDAVRALARGLSTSYRDMPAATRREPLDSAWSTQVLDEARARLP